MISPRFSEQSSRSGSSNNDTALTSATDEGFGRIDSAFSPNAVGSKPRRRSSAMAGEGFGGPYVHASRLREISLDQIVNKALLAKYTEKMVAEWRDIALYGTVLLGANVAFLAIQTVDVTPEDGHTRTSAQRASYFSVLASLGTIISSLVLLILVRHREVMGDGLIQRRSQSRWGLEALALMYGTPFSLVIWAYVI
ncbi:hypothetical protein FA13DRAFT_69964 [Coprinellus micaceus]|uniref:Uncharacterized protein n=1 Tax=Coprinellus micaceus TaxID=71717 RepID=A0A4Y7TJI5_COPMI|nr:hypothetical protein FA13DRAFT_69964 [Coprinellus micaceus]